MAELIQDGSGEVKKLPQPRSRGPTIQGEHGRYTITRAISQTNTMRYHICHDEDEQWRVLCIAATIADNPTVAHVAELLEDLACASDGQEQEYAELMRRRVSYIFFESETVQKIRTVVDAANKVKSERGEGEYVEIDYDAPPTRQELEEVDRQRQQLLRRRLNYDQLFPRVLDSFICNPQGHRQVNILELTSVDLSQVMLLEQILQKQQRTSLKTSAWIVQRMLRLFAFTREAQLTVNFETNRFLIGPQGQHLVMMDWENTRKLGSQEWNDGNLNLARIGECGLKLINATFDEQGWQYPYELAEQEKPYLDFLYQLATLRKRLYYYDNEFAYVYDGYWRRRCGDTRYAHTVFDQLVKEIWGNAEAEFLTLPI